MKIKICGITNLEDALLALEAGADLLGYNFYQGSSRYLAPAACARIQSELAGLGGKYIGVGVFVDAPSDEIRQVLSDCGLQLAQLHGGEPPEQLRKLGNVAYKGIRPRTRQEGMLLAETYPPRTHPPALLLDAHHPQLFGGTGRKADWSLAQELAARSDLLLAGGLTPSNVFRAVERVRPWGVDVASGVETAPGRKGASLLKAFITQARLAENASAPVPNQSQLS
jgi:phosphoribosylanthranilate isomerase